MFCSRIRPVPEYAAPIWGGLPKYLADELQHVQDRSLDIIGLPRNTLQPLALRREVQTKNELQRIFDCENHPCKRFLTNPVEHGYNLRSELNTIEARAISLTIRHENSFIPRAVKILNKSNHK